MESEEQNIGHAGMMGVMQPQRYRKRCEQQISMSIPENFLRLIPV